MTLEQAIDEYGPLVLRIAWRITRDEAATQDICQESFLKLHEAQQRGQVIDYPKAWLARVAGNAAVDVCRARDHIVRLNGSEHASHTPGMLAQVEQSLLLDQIHRRIPDLPDRQREVFILRHFEDMPFTEIGRVIGITPLAARSASFQALQKMRLWLTGADVAQPDTHSAEQGR